METGRPAVTVQVGDEGALLEGGKVVVRVGRFGIRSEGWAHRHHRERRRMTAGQTFWDIDEAQPSGALTCVGFSPRLGFCAVCGICQLFQMCYFVMIFFLILNKYSPLFLILLIILFSYSRLNKLQIH